MHTPRDGILGFRHASSLACLWLFLVLVSPALAPSQACAAAPLNDSAPCAAYADAAPALAAWYDPIWRWIESRMNNRTGAIQFGLIFMLIALWIIWWRK